MGPFAWALNGHPGTMGHLECHSGNPAALGSKIIECIHVCDRDVVRTALFAPQHPMQTHVPALITCTMTSLRWTTAPLGGCNNPATRKYGSNGDCAKSVEKYPPRGDLKIARRKVKSNMLWDFWNLSESSMIRRPWNLSLSGLPAYLAPIFQECHQRQADNPILKWEGKQGIQNEALERFRITALGSSNIVFEELRALSSSNHSPTSHDICKQRLRSLILNGCQRTWVCGHTL